MSGVKEGVPGDRVLGPWCCEAAGCGLAPRGKPLFQPLHAHPPHPNSAATPHLLGASAAREHLRSTADEGLEGGDGFRTAIS